MDRSNEEWVQALRDPTAGPAARRDLRALLVAGLRRLLRGRNADLSLADDLAHEALLRIDARLDSFRGDSRFTTWALSVATRVAFDELRHQRWKDVSLDSLDASAPVDVEDPQPVADATLGRARVLAQLRRIIDQALTPHQRRALMGELAGLPPTELAGQLSMTRNALYKLTHDARRKLKAALLAAGITADEAAAVFEQ